MNPHIKTKFLNMSRSALAKEDAAWCFRFFEPAEALYNKDLFDFTSDEIDFLLDELYLPAKDRNKLRVLAKRYMDWCSEQGLCNSILNPTIQRMVYSSKNLQHIMDEVFTPEELCTVDLVYRAYFWLAFIGVPKEVARTIRKDAVALDIGYVLYNQRAYSMPPESIFSLEKCKNLKEFLFIGPHSQKWRRRGDCEELISGFLGVYSPTSILIETSKRATNKPYMLTYDNVRKSGLFARVYKNEREFAEDTLTEIIIKEGWKPSDNIQAFRRYIRKLGDDYLGWKHQFSSLIEDEQNN